MFRKIISEGCDCIDRLNDDTRDRNNVRDIIIITIVTNRIAKRKRVPETTVRARSRIRDLEGKKHHSYGERRTNSDKLRPRISISSDRERTECTAAINLFQWPVCSARVK